MLEQHLMNYTGSWSKSSSSRAQFVGGETAIVRLGVLKHGDRGVVGARQAVALKARVRFPSVTPKTNTWASGATGRRTRLKSGRV